MFDIFYSPSGALITLFLLTILYFFENYDRYLIAVSPIPYIDYSSYEYSILAGPSFTIMYTVGGLLFSLGYSDNIQLFGNSKFSKTGVLAFATFIFSLAFGATAFCVTFWQQVIVRVVMGLSQSVITPFSTSVIRDYFPPDVCGSAFGIFNTGTYFAFALSLSLGVWVYEEYGWKTGYICFGIIGMGTSLFLPLLSFLQTPKVSENALNNNKKEQIETQRYGSQSSSSGEGRRSPSFSTSPNTTTQSPLIPETEMESITASDTFLEEPSSTPSSPSLQDSKDPTSLFGRMVSTLHEVVCVYWWRHPGIYVLCLATAVRIGGGYIWSAYTGIFFSELFVKEDGSIDCSFSYSNSTTTMANEYACGSDYPYCVNSVCSALTEFPWHNQGMDSTNMEEYMSWVPIAGSALGSFLGGLVSDHVIKMNCDNRAEDELLDDMDVDKSTHPATALVANNNNNTSEVSLPIGRNVKKKVNKYVAGRALIAGITCLLSLPLVIYSFFLDSPGCFLIYIASGMIGEVYLSQTLALITDHQLIPTRLITSAVALFMLIITIIGGNSPLLIPLIEEYVGYDSQVNVQFQAAAPYTGNPYSVTTTFDVPNSDANKLLYSMLYALIGCYSLSGLLYILAFWMMVYQ